MKRNKIIINHENRRNNNENPNVHSYVPLPFYALIAATADGHYIASAFGAGQRLRFFLGNVWLYLHYVEMENKHIYYIRLEKKNFDTYQIVQ